MSRGLPDWATRARAGWRWTGAERPPFAAVPAPGQESVWDFPRPPQLEAVDRHVLVRFDGTLVAETRSPMRVLETSHPPTYYIPREDVREATLLTAPGTSRCEWKGSATYWTVRSEGGRVEERVGWSYEDPFEDFARLRGYLSFYPSRLECFVDGARVLPQAGGFYGGWVTSDVVGPFKGEPGTERW